MKETGNEIQALQMLSDVYYKILKVNLTLDQHEEIKVIPDEMNWESGYSDRISGCGDLRIQRSYIPMMWKSICCFPIVII